MHKPSTACIRQAFKINREWVGVGMGRRKRLEVVQGSIFRLGVAGFEFMYLIKADTARRVGNLARYPPGMRTLVIY